MVQSEYIPLLIHKANEQGLDEDVKRMLVGFEVAGQHESLYGVEYVAGEWQESDASAEKKVDVFIQDVAEGDLEAYREQFVRIDDEYGDEIDSVLQKHDN